MRNVILGIVIDLDESETESFEYGSSGFAEKRSWSPVNNGVPFTEGELEETERRHRAL